LPISNLARVPPALGQRLLTHQLLRHGGWVALVGVVLVVLLVVYWGRIAEWIERRWFRG
jgi:hypothetical protein